MEIESLEKLTVLANAQRLAVMRLLIRRYPSAVRAGEIGDVLGLKPSTASVYLSALCKAGLISQARAGTRLFYQAKPEGLQALFDFLFIECCQGRPDICAPLPETNLAKGADMTDQKFNVLFICTGNSARSIFAETLLREFGSAQFDVFSAGTMPKSELNPFALQILRDKGHEIGGLRAKNVSEFHTEDAPKMDFVFTVCDHAANEHCESWDGQPISAHWGVADPVKAEGTDAEKSLAFQQAYGALRNRIQAFAALPITSLDRISLQKAVDEIERGAVANA